MYEIKQYRRNTAYSWAIFRDNTPITTGLTLEQALKAKEILEKQNESKHRQGLLQRREVFINT